jgi:hypothetical protein
LAHGHESADLPVYFNQSPVLNAAGGGFGGFGGGGGRGGAPGTNLNGGIGQNDAECAAAADSTVRGGHQRAAVRLAASVPGRRHAQLRQMAQKFGITIDDTRPRVVMQSANLTDMPLSARCSTASSSQPRGGARLRPRQGARRDVCDPAVLALADAGHLHPRLQCDHELERSRCGEGGARRARNDRRAATVNRVIG